MLATSNQMLATAAMPFSAMPSTLALQSTNPIRSALIHKSVLLKQDYQPVQNRVKVLLVHIPKLSIRGQARLAAEVGVSRSTVSRLVNGRINPSYRLARGITSALERLLGYPLDIRDVFSTDGTYLTASGCVLCKCVGCLPDEAYDAEDDLRPEWRGQKPGDWSMTYPDHATNTVTRDGEGRR